ncbi:unnamed protein product, partial [marine sediment metagenome]
LPLGVCSLATLDESEQENWWDNRRSRRLGNKMKEEKR